MCGCLCLCAVCGWQTFTMAALGSAVFCSSTAAGTASSLPLYLSLSFSLAISLSAFVCLQSSLSSQSPSLNPPLSFGYTLQQQQLVRIHFYRNWTNGVHLIILIISFFFFFCRSLTSFSFSEQHICQFFSCQLCRFAGCLSAFISRCR